MVQFLTGITFPTISWAVSSLAVDLLPTTVLALCPRTAVLSSSSLP